MAANSSPDNSQLSDDAGLSDLDVASPTPRPSGGRTKPPKLGQALQKRSAATATANPNDTSASALQQQQFAPQPQQQQQQQQQQQVAQQQPDAPQNDTIAPPANRGRRIVPVHQSRITDRPAKVGEKDSSLKIKIELDLEVEVEIFARVKGDIMIGLM